MEDFKTEGQEREDSNRGKSHRSCSRDANHVAHHVLELQIMQIPVTMLGNLLLPPPQSESAHSKDLRLFTMAEWRAGLDRRPN